MSEKGIKNLGHSRAMSLIINKAKRGFKLVDFSSSQSVTNSKGKQFGLLPRVTPNRQYSFEAWYELYEPYVETIIQNIISHLYNYPSERYAYLLNKSSLENDLRRYIYKTSSNASKGYYFLK